MTNAHPRIGDQAPPLSLPSLDGGQVSLESLRGKPVWLGFYRYAACPLCNLRIHEMTQRYGGRHGKDLHILAVFQSPLAKMRKYVARHEAPFPLLSDPEERMYATYGLGASVLGFVKAGGPAGAMRLAKAASKGFVALNPDPDGTVPRLPGDFLLDANGVIQDVFMAKEISEHIPFERVDAFLARQG